MQTFLGLAFLVLFVSAPAIVAGVLAFGLGVWLGGSKLGMLAGGAAGFALGWVVIILMYLDIERRNPGGSAMMELVAIPVIAVATVTGVMIGAAVGRWRGWP